MGNGLLEPPVFPAGEIGCELVEVELFGFLRDLAEDLICGGATRFDLRFIVLLTPDESLFLIPMPHEPQVSRYTARPDILPEGHDFALQFAVQPRRHLGTRSDPPHAGKQHLVWRITEPTLNEQVRLLWLTRVELS